MLEELKKYTGKGKATPKIAIPRSCYQLQGWRNRSKGGIIVGLELLAEVELWWTGMMVAGTIVKSQVPLVVKEQRYCPTERRRNTLVSLSILPFVPLSTNKYFFHWGNLGRK